MTQGNRISDLTVKATLDAGDSIPVASGGQNFKFDLGTELAKRPSVANFAAIATHDISTGTDRIEASDTGAVYIYDAAVDAAFVAAHPRASAITANGRGFRLDLIQPLNVLMFGAVADDNGTTGTDNAAAFAAASDYLQLYALPGFIAGTLYRGGASLRIPIGAYYTSQPLSPLFTGEIYGDGGLGWGAPTRIRFPAGVDGIQVQAHNTSSTATFDSVIHFAGDQLHIRDIYFTGGYAGTEGEFHGCRAKRPFDLTRCTFDNFQGDGLYSHVSFGNGTGAQEGNSNVLRATNCVFTNCRSGISTQNSDANAWTVIACSFISNRRWALEDRSFLGNHYYGCHFDANGRGANNTGLSGKPTSYAEKNGHVYFAIDGQETWCATNAPSGTTADNQGWGYFNEGPPIPASDVPTWFSGINVRSGGHILISGAANGSTVDGSHTESNAVSQIDQSAMVYGDVLSTTVAVSGGIMNRARTNSIRAGSNGVSFGGNVNIDGDFRARSPNNVLGPNDGAAIVDGATVLGSRSTSHALNFCTFDASGVPTTPYASVTYSVAAGITHDAATGLGHRFRVNGVEVARAEAGGLKLPAGNGYFVNGLQVVGARGASLPTAATDLASAITLVNAIAARLKTTGGHGLVAD